MNARDFVIRRANLATLSETQGYGEVIAGAVVVRDGRIAWLGADRDLPKSSSDTDTVDAQGAWLTPALIDCHTHLIWAGSRANEFEQRLHGASYQDIARAGGGIVSSVRATRAASEDELLRQALPRARALRAEGVSTIEIKSGYGLDRDTELRMLRVARELGRQLDLRVSTTLLAAHALPPEYAGRADDYIDLVCNDILPAAHAQGLVDAVDAFCEGIGFTPAQTRRVFDSARALGLPMKLHADQLSDLGGAALVAEFGGLSADHVEYTSDASIASMARAGTVAVLLPGAFYCLRETKLPPIAAFREHGVPMALSTDCNPGTSPCTSLLLMLHMACTLFRLTPAEALAGVTRHAARALGLQDSLGQLRVDMKADLALWAIDHPRDLAAYFGRNPLLRAWREGRALA